MQTGLPDACGQTLLSWWSGRLRSRRTDCGIALSSRVCRSVRKRCFSHSSKVQLVHRAKASGYEVNLVYVHLATELYAARVVQRVTEGGHDVPTEKIVPRVVRLRERVREALPMCDTAWLYDNSDSERPFELVLSVQAGRVSVHVMPAPSWATRLVSELRPG